MTDNLKTRIAEAIENMRMHTSLYDSDDIAQAVLDIVEPMIPKWMPIESAPKDGTFVIIAGKSGYTTTQLRCAVARYVPDYRPLSPWQTHSNDSFTDGGESPTHWQPLPTSPEKE